MELKEPIAVYNAATNVEAHVVAMFLVEGGVEAFATEDLSLVGLWMFGTLPEIHKPQVWVSAADRERAAQLLQDYERQAAERTQTTQDDESLEPIEVVCEECGQASSFPAEQRGSVQYCPHCAAHLDVESGDDGDRYWLDSNKPDGG
jgi:hypothetical protein